MKQRVWALIELGDILLCTVCINLILEKFATAVLMKKNKEQKLWKK